MKLLILCIITNVYPLPASSVETNNNLYDCIHLIANKSVLVKTIIILREEIENYKVSVDLLLKLNWPKMIMNSNQSSLKHLQGVYLLFPDSNCTDYLNLFEKSSKMINSKYIIYTESMFAMFTLFDISWKFRVIDIIALYGSKEDTILVFTYFPYGTHGCMSTQPVLIDSCFRKYFQYDYSLFSRKNKLYNYHGCRIKVTLKDKTVESVDTNADDLAFKLLKFLSIKMNFTMLINVADAGENAYAAAYQNFTSASVISVARGDSELGVGRFSQILDYHPMVITSKEISMDCFTWAVPIKAGKVPSIWYVYVNEFDYLTWILIVLVYFLIALLFNYIFSYFIRPKNDRNLNVLHIFGTFINVSVKSHIFHCTERVMYASWLLYSFVTISAYQASLGSLVTVPPEIPEIDTTQYLLQTGLALKSEPKIYHVLSASRETSEQIKLVLDSFELILPDENFSSAVHNIYKKRNLALFHTSDKLAKTEYEIKLKLNTNKIVHIINDCLISSPTSPFILRKDNFLIEPINDFVTRLFESGILKYWDRNTLEFSTHNSTNLHSASMNIINLFGGLAVLIIGYVMAIFIFLAEILSKTWNL
ncbi:uncharacterized protein [Rhodnius prolixus]|uniref:Ionotropic glutamate receptor C-terminal domain-containing protein n=1 Tax=Rhodnius prolixus TaxID=13249 RepID=T1H9Z3_RHOPR